MRALQETAASLRINGLWRRIAHELEQNILDRAYESGERLPGEVNMARRFGVGRNTVRRALAELVERGVVRTETGGTYVQVRLTYPISARTRFSEIVDRAGHAPEAWLTAHRREPASREIAARLGLADDEPVIRLEILRTADGMPMSLATSHVPADLMPDAARVFARLRSMTKTLAHFGIIDYRRRKTSIKAALADPVQAQHLGLSPGRPLFIKDSIDVAHNGRSVLTTHACVPADRVELLVEY
jgi:GntR family transcriptional regulator, phosphonate transport system regulatory protein